MMRFPWWRGFLFLCGLVLTAGSAVAATFSLNRSGYGQNEAITASWTREEEEAVGVTDWIGLYTPEQIPDNASPSLRWLYLGGSDIVPDAPVRSGQVTFSAPGLAPGNYVARFFAHDGYTEIAAAVAFTVIFGLGETSYAAGDDLVAHWRRAADTPRTATDWIGVYQPNQTPGASSPSLLWFYLNGSRTAPDAPVEEGTITFLSPDLEPGNYVARFFTNDGYTQLCAGVAFEITASGGPTPPVFVGTPNALRDAIAGEAYTGCVRGYARDDDPGETLAFAKVAGPAWVQVAADGVLSGTPAATDLGEVELVIAVTDLLGNTMPGTFTFRVRAPGDGRVERLNVMSYNLFHGWGMFRHGERKGFDTIALSRADIICTAESTNNAGGGSGKFQPREVAREFGWHYAGTSGDLGILSRWPITATYPVSGGAALGARIRISENPLQEVVVYSLHLDWRYYGPYEAKETWSTDASVLLEESRSERERQTITLLAAIQAQLDEADDTPVVVAGDFNCPSHQDWTPANAFQHDGRVVAWPVTVRLTKAGLIDSFREVHPDPVAMPGNTWSPLYTDIEPQDRIDFVFYKGRGWQAETSEIFHPTVEVQVTDYSHSLAPTVDNTWPSDHAAVVTRFRAVTPPASPLESWRQAHFGAQVSDPALAGDLADPDGDGLPNLVEYALGQAPREFTPPLAFAVENGALTLTYAVSIAATDVTLTPEWSADLDTWHTSRLITKPLGETDGLRHFRVRLPQGTDGPEFLRLNVTVTEE